MSITYGRPKVHSIIKSLYERIKAIRELAGSDFDIIIDMHANSDKTAAIQFGQAFAPLGILYYEEPVDPLNPSFYKQVKDNVPPSHCWR